MILTSLAVVAFRTVRDISIDAVAACWTGLALSTGEVALEEASWTRELVVRAYRAEATCRALGSRDRRVCRESAGITAVRSGIARTSWCSEPSAFAFISWRTRDAVGVVYGSLLVRIRADWTRISSVVSCAFWAEIPSRTGTIFPGCKRQWVPSRR